VVLVKKSGHAKPPRARRIACGTIGRAGPNARPHVDMARSSTSAPEFKHSMEDLIVPVLSRRSQIAGWKTAQAQMNAHGQNGMTGTAVNIPVEVEVRPASELFSLLQQMGRPAMLLVMNCEIALRASALWTASLVTGLLGHPAVSLVVKAECVVHDRWRIKWHMVVLHVAPGKSQRYATSASARQFVHSLTGRIGELARSPVVQALTLAQNPLLQNPLLIRIA